MAFESKVDFYKHVYFNENEYLANKAASLNKLDGTTTWTAAATRQAINDAGMTIWEHFAYHGAFERAADGSYGINPSSYFDIDKYYSEKLEQCKSLGMNLSKQDMVDTFQGLALNPITHYAICGYAELLVPRLEDAASGSYSTSAGRPLSGDYKIDSLLYAGSDWNSLAAGQNNTLYYSFAEQLPSAFMRKYSLTNYYGMNDNQKAGVHTAAEYISAVTGINMVYTADYQNANINFFWAYDGQPDYAGATYYEDYSPVYIRLTSKDASGKTLYQDWQQGTDAYSTLLHEFGHALGLKHPFAAAGSWGTLLPAREDNDIYTTMSYTTARSTGDNWYYDTGSDDYFSPYDLMALNFLYGSDGLNGREGLVYSGASYASLEELGLVGVQTDGEAAVMAEYIA